MFGLAVLAFRTQEHSKGARRLQQIDQTYLFAEHRNEPFGVLRTRVLASPTPPKHTRKYPKKAKLVSKSIQSGLRIHPKPSPWANRNPSASKREPKVAKVAIPKKKDSQNAPFCVAFSALAANKCKQRCNKRPPETCLHKGAGKRAKANPPKPGKSCSHAHGSVVLLQALLSENECKRTSV
jgi:hypothetical protein